MDNDRISLVLPFQSIAKEIKGLQYLAERKGNNEILISRENNKDLIRSIITEEVHGEEFYDKIMLEELFNKVNYIKYNLHIEKLETVNIINTIKDFIKSNVTLRKKYFEDYDENERKYRTAYAALVNGEAMCAGYTEATRILLSTYGIKTVTLLSKLPESNKRILHYVCVFEDSNGEFLLIDPEREQNCHKKGIDFKQYASEMIFIVPDQHFIDNKCINDGAGPYANDYISKNTKWVKGIDKLNELKEHIEVLGQIELKVCS